MDRKLTDDALERETEDIERAEVDQEWSTPREKGRILNHSRPFDRQMWSEHPAVDALVDEIYEAHSFNGHKRLCKTHLRVLLLNLYCNWCCDEELKTQFSLNEKKYKKKTRYNEVGVSREIIKVAKQLEQAGLLRIIRGFNDRSTGKSKEARIWPTGPLKEHFKAARFGMLDIAYRDNRETVIKRDKDGKDVEYIDDDTTNSMRVVLNDYNALLTAR